MGDEITAKSKGEDYLNEKIDSYWGHFLIVDKEININQYDKDVYRVTISGELWQDRKYLYSFSESCYIKKENGKWCISDLPFLEKPTTPQYTMSYVNINVSTAKELIETSSFLNLTIADCSGGCHYCFWKSGEYIPYAQWIEFPDALYNSTFDILVYCRDGTKSKNFCEHLLNHVYGKIYNLEGGYRAWKKDV
jgi:rhodanese-related sulfurtransferase